MESKEWLSNDVFGIRKIFLVKDLPNVITDSPGQIRETETS